ncbi:unnamed protein product [Plasmodium vivax]|uniref:(malaria parasite P. vivax) hypothetical protein n=1 Tax=Plasmodium vivax TaxID=5855 RepID=A0A8S4HM28_PLAVI|nr:unnamed protein product [Plasmodium vivax]
MAISDKDFSVDKIKQEYKFIDGSNFYKIYNEFNWPCINDIYTDFGASCLPGDSDDWTEFSEVNELLSNLYSNLYRVYYTIAKRGNDYFEKNLEEVKTMGCTYLKYWLYDQITSKKFDESQITKFFDGIYNHIKNHIHSFKVDYCNFSRLSLDEIKSIKKLYAFNAIIYTGYNISDACNHNSCNYDYFEEALIEFINSIKKCSSDSSNMGYCNEFNEFLSVCNDENTYSGITIKNDYKGYSTDPIDKISHLLHNPNRSTIAATSIVGSAIGLPSIFYYLYKFRPFGRTLRKRKGENIVNIDEAAHNSLLYTTDTEQLPLQNREYKVAYHTFSDT